MYKEALRDILFKKYFQTKDGILISDLVNKLSFIPEAWKQLHLLCEHNIKHFDSFSQIEQCKILVHHQKRYLIIKLRMWRYVIIDIDSMKNITQTEFRNEFDENFFINNFAEEKEEDPSLYFRLYQIERYEGNVQELIDFYIENQSILCLSSQLYYKLEFGKAWTWFHIDFVNASAQMGFQTVDQLLYEQLFLNYDLTACGLQDAQQKMGIAKMREIFSKIKDIQMPIECIPQDLYHQYLTQCSTNANKRTKKKPETSNSSVSD